MKQLTLFIMLCLLSISSYAGCTGLVAIEKLSPREGGWVHIKAEGMNDMDIMNCGNNSGMGMLLNLSDNHGTTQGKQLLYSTLLAAFAAGKKMQLCSDGCDSKFSTYTRLSHINNLQ